MTQLKIKVTKEILEKSKYCGPSAQVAKTSCAVALPIRDIFPEAAVYLTYIDFFGQKIRLPTEATLFIDRFDKTNTKDRPCMPELEFTIDIPDAVIEMINIDEIRPLLINHPTLELVEG